MLKEEATSKETSQKNGTNTKAKLKAIAKQTINAIKTVVTVPMVALNCATITEKKPDSPTTIYNFFVQEETTLSSGKLVYRLCKVAIKGERIGGWIGTNVYYVQEQNETDEVFPFFQAFVVDNNGTLDREWVEDVLTKPHDGHPYDHNAVLVWEHGPPAIIDLDLEKAFRILHGKMPKNPPAPVWLHEILKEVE